MLQGCFGVPRTNSTNVFILLSHGLLHEQSIELLCFHLGVNHEGLEVAAEVRLQLLPEAHLVHLTVRLPKKVLPSDLTGVTRKSVAKARPETKPGTIPRKKYILLQSAGFVVVLKSF